MKISVAFPSKYLRAADLQDRAVKVLLDTVRMEDVGDGEPKPVLYFIGKEKGMVLNKTNATNIQVVHGDDTDQWHGKEMVLFTAWVDFQGKSVQAIRIRPPQTNERSAAPTQPRQAQQVAQAYNQGPPTDVGAELSDEIPF